MLRYFAFACLPIAATPGFLAACSSNDPATVAPPVDAGPDAPAPIADAAPDTRARDAASDAAPDGGNRIDASDPVDAAPDAVTCDTAKDPRNCGACGHDCLVGTCSKGICGGEVIDPTNGTTDVVMDATNVYYLSSAGARAVPRGGNTPVTVVNTGSAAHLAQRDGTLYISTPGSYAVLTSAPISARDATATTLGSYGSYFNPNGLAVTATDVIAADGCNVLKAIPRAGGQARTIWQIGCNSTKQNNGLVLDDTQSYAHTYDDYKNRFRRVRLSDGALSEWAYTDTVLAMTFANGKLYWLAGIGCASLVCPTVRLYSSQPDGSGQTKIAEAAVSTYVNGTGMLLEGDHLYVGGLGPSDPTGRPGAQRLMRIDLRSGDLLPVYDGWAASVVADDRFLYIADPNRGFRRVGK